MWVGGWTAESMKDLGCRPWAAGWVLVAVQGALGPRVDLISQEERAFRLIPSFTHASVLTSNS